MCFLWSVCPPPPCVQANPWGGIPTPGQGCLYGDSTQVSVTKSQQNVVIQVPTASNDVLYLYTGDR